MKYVKPEMEILKFEIEDVICASVGGTYEGGDGNETGVSGSWAPQSPAN